jgi:hypothetical protein
MVNEYFPFMGDIIRDGRRNNRENTEFERTD